MCVSLECYTYTQTQVVHTVYTVCKQVTLVRCVAIIKCEVQSRTVSPRINTETYFRRYIEAPGIVFGFEYVESRLQLRILRTDFYAYIRLEDTATIPRITGGKTERQLEQRMLLVGIDASAFCQWKCLASEIFMVAVVGQEASQCEIRRYVITAFEVHTPSAAFIGKVVTHGEVELPIDVGITVIGHLCLCRHG